jgi:hypothetical protein
MSASLLLKHYFILASLPFSKCQTLPLLQLGKDIEKKFKGGFDKNKKLVLYYVTISLVFFRGNCDALGRSGNGMLLFIGVANATSGVEGPGRPWKALISQHL